MVVVAEEQTETEDDPVAEEQDPPEGPTLGTLQSDGGATLNPEAVLQECRQIEPRVVELAMHRVHSKLLQQQNKTLMRALHEATAGQPAGEDET